MNAKPFQKLPGSRLSTFLEIERDALKPLPERALRAGLLHDGESQCRLPFRSAQELVRAPKHLMGKNVDVSTATTVEALHDGTVAIHARTMKRGKHVTKKSICLRSNVNTRTGVRAPHWLGTHDRPEHGRVHREDASIQTHAMAYRSCPGVPAPIQDLPFERGRGACTRALKQMRSTTRA